MCKVLQLLRVRNACPEAEGIITTFLRLQKGSGNDVDCAKAKKIAVSLQLKANADRFTMIAMDTFNVEMVKEMNLLYYWAKEFNVLSATNRATNREE